MTSVGKTYLLTIEKPKEEKVGDIILAQLDTQYNTISYIGTIENYGTGFTEEEKKNLIPIGTKVIIDYNNTLSDKVKVFMNDKTYYIYQPQDIIATIEE